MRSFERSCVVVAVVIAAVGVAVVGATAERNFHERLRRKDLSVLAESCCCSFVCSVFEI